MEPTPREYWLYVCINNVGRSQWAAAWHNRLHPGEATSAGTDVDKPGGLVRNWRGGADMITAVSLADGIHIGNERRTQLDTASLEGRTRLVAFDKLAFEDFYKGAVRRLVFPEIIIEDIEDPRDMSFERTRDIYEKIVQVVSRLAT